MRTPDMVRSALARHGQYKIKIFDNWHEIFT
jgi:hypothetical protein